MQDLRDQLEKLRAEAEDCTLISRLAADKAKRELFARLAAQIQGMIAELETAIAARIAGGET
jgi:heme oxygenase